MAALKRTITRSAINGFPSPALDFIFRMKALRPSSVFGEGNGPCGSDQRFIGLKAHTVPFFS